VISPGPTWDGGNERGRELRWKKGIGTRGGCSAYWTRARRSRPSGQKWEKKRTHKKPPLREQKKKKEERNAKLRGKAGLKGKSAATQPNEP